MYLHSPSGKGVITGHADGTIVRYMLEEEGGNMARVLGLSFLSGSVVHSIHDCRGLCVTTPVLRMPLPGVAPPL